jgi:hypothetical protein
MDFRGGEGFGICQPKVTGVHLKAGRTPNPEGIASWRPFQVQEERLWTITAMLWKHFAAAALLAQDAAAQNVNVGRLLRFACSQLVIERTDPIVNPGLNPSPHTHQVVGGNSFNISVRISPLSASRGAG